MLDDLAREAHGHRVLLIESVTELESNSTKRRVGETFRLVGTNFAMNEHELSTERRKHHSIARIGDAAEADFADRISQGISSGPSTRVHVRRTAYKLPCACASMRW